MCFIGKLPFRFLIRCGKTGSGTVDEKGNNIRLEVIGSFPFGFQARAYPLIVAIRLTVLHIEWHMSLYLYTFIFICEYLSRLFTVPRALYYPKLLSPLYIDISHVFHTLVLPIKPV